MKQARSNCRECARETNHDVLHEVVSDEGTDFYDEKNVWQTLKCRGCDTIGFRLIHIDYETWDEDEHGKSVPLRTYTRFPAALARHKKLGYLWAVPELIRNVYLETVSAYAVGSTVIAGMGLRAVIEAVCNHLSVSGRSLDKRIDALYKNGSISNVDKKRLHAIRFLGNDAAHEIKVPSNADLRVALEVVEHLINSVFILEKRVGGLDTSIETYDELLPLLKRCAAKQEVGAVLSLAGILGGFSRRLGEFSQALETALIERVKVGDVKFLELDAVQTVEKKEVQTYKIKEKLVDLDEIPF